VATIGKNRRKRLKRDWIFWLALSGILLAAVTPVLVIYIVLPGFSAVKTARAAYDGAAPAEGRQSVSGAGSAANASVKGAPLPASGWQPGTALSASGWQPGTAFFASSRQPGLPLPASSRQPGTTPPASGLQPGTVSSAAQSPPPTPEPVLTAKISFVGDLMVHQWQADAAYDKTTGEYDFDRGFDYVRGDLAASDFAVGNLETTFGGGAFSDFPTFSAPDSFADALKNAGFDFVTTANNHCNDKRSAGLLRTLDVLDAAGIGHTGTFRSPEERDGIRAEEINGLKFVFLAYTYSTNGIPVEAGMPFLVNMLDKQSIKDQIERAKALSPDVIVVLPHMGAEYSAAPSAETKDWARYMLDCGADAVVASHPHVIQAVKTGAGASTREGPAPNGPSPPNEGAEGITAYSMGNFISSQRDLPRDYGMILNLEFEKKGNGKAVCVRVSFIPTWVKFVNSLGAYDIQVLPVRDALEDYNDGNSMLIRPEDYLRLLDVNREITRKLLGEAKDAQREYVLYERDN